MMLYAFQKHHSKSIIPNGMMLPVIAFWNDAFEKA